MKELTGPYAKAIDCDLGSAEVDPGWSQTISHWIIESDRYHPLWRQWLLAALRLDDVEGLPPPAKKFDGATHEILIVAINPEHRITPELVVTPGYKMHHLEPINFADQFTATDEEVRTVCELMAKSICHGIHTPEPGLGYGSFRKVWLESIVKTFAHIRGEEHTP